MLAASHCSDALGTYSSGQQPYSALVCELCTGATDLHTEAKTAQSDLHLLGLLQAARIPAVSVSADSRLKAALVDRLLPACPAITHLEVESFIPQLLPPNLTRLNFRDAEPAALPRALEDSQVLLTRLGQAQHLKILRLELAAQICIPASLAGLLPSLQTCIVCTHLHDTAESLMQGEDPAVLERSGSIDPGACSRAAGCPAQLKLLVDASDCFSLERPVFRTHLLPSLAALGPELHTLDLSLDARCVLGILPALAQLQLAGFHLSVVAVSSGYTLQQPITLLPACHDKSICCDDH